jgi:stearoyl-CoA desaturase (delta-9 desaturase)
MTTLSTPKAVGQDLGARSAAKHEASTLGRLITLVVASIPFLGLLLAVHQLWDRQVNGSDLAVFGILYLFSGLGVCVGFHRLATHRSFVAVSPVRAALLALGSMAVEGDVVYWVATHLEHHARSDREGDPHSPRDGFWHAHIGWMLGPFSASPDIYCRHLKQDRLVRFIARTFFGWAALSLALPALLDGWLSMGTPGGFGIGALHGLLWGGLVRICFTHHVTWSVNSICHSFGQRPFAATRDSSRNNFIIGLLAFGEGWHNNHHAFPAAAYHGFSWWQIDLSGYLIRLLKLLRLARNVQMPSASARARQRARPDAVAASRPAGQPI